MLFKQMIEQCGLDRQEAATYLDYSLGAVKKWIAGERVLPDDVIAKMAGLNNIINENANRIANKLIADGTIIDNKTIRAIQDKLPELPALPIKGIEEACLARAVLIVALEQQKNNQQNN